MLGLLILLFRIKMLMIYCEELNNSSFTSFCFFNLEMRKLIIRQIYF